MTNLLATRPAAGGGGGEVPPTPANKGLLIGIPLAVLALVVVFVARGDGIYILGFLGFVVALLVSVSLHEGGHFWTARRFGMKATQFFVGFGPTVWSTRRGETEWGFKAIPAGGFVKIVGMTQLEDVPPGDEDRAFWRQPAKQRIVVLAAGSTVHFIIAILLVLLSSFAIGKAVETTPAVGSIAACVPLDVEDACGEGPSRPAPAKAAGLQAGDVVVQVAGERVDDSFELLELIRGAGAQPLPLVVERDGERITTSLTPVEVTRPGLPLRNEDGTFVQRDGEFVFGPDRQVGVVGIGVQERLVTERLGPVEAIEHSGEQMKLIVTGIWTTFSEKLGTITKVYGPERDPEGFIGIYGAGRISGEVLASDETLAFKVLGFLGLIAGLNFFVGVFNLLPLLPLDGGHIAVLLYEQARDKLKRLRGYTGELVRVDLTKLLPVTYAVVLFFAGFTVWLLGADIVNPITLNP
jgi:membrane-associated protease RseP (regulator of RpoE activity)